MSRLFVIAGLFILLATGNTQASIILLDYNSVNSPPTIGGTWNTFPTPVGGQLLDSSGDATGINIGFTNVVDSSTLQGSWAAGNKEWVDGKAVGDYFTSAFGTSATITFSGFAAGSRWRFDHVAARRSTSTAFIADYRVNGLFADSNPNGANFRADIHGWQQGNILTWNSVIADQNGEITFTGTVGANAFAHFNASRLTQLSQPVPEPATLAVWSLIGICGVGYGVRRRMKKASE